MDTKLKQRLVMTFSHEEVSYLIQMADNIEEHVMIGRFSDFVGEFREQMYDMRRRMDGHGA